MSSKRNSRVTTIHAAGILAFFAFGCNCFGETPGGTGAGKVATAAPAAREVVTVKAAEKPCSTSVQVYIELIIQKKYGLMAHVFGHADETVRRDSYDESKPWWKNPLVVFSDPVMTEGDVAAQSDAAALAGKGTSANVAVGLTLVPHAEVTYKGPVRCDGVKGVITINIDTMNDYFDSEWTPMLRLKGHAVTFAFDTCRPGAAVEEVTHEKRSMPLFQFERYTREHERWDHRSEWPREAEAGDFRTTIVGKDAVLEITGYRYKGVASAR